MKLQNYIVFLHKNKNNFYKWKSKQEEMQILSY